MNDAEFDRRVRAFFAGAPRPSAPEKLWRVPSKLEAEPGLEPVRARGQFAGKWQASLGMACMVVAIVALAVGTRAVLPGGAPDAPPADPSVPTAAPRIEGLPYALDGLTWQEVGIGAFEGLSDLWLFETGQGHLVVGTKQSTQIRLWYTPDGFDFQPLDASAFAVDDPSTSTMMVNSVVKGPAGYIAAGTEWSLGPQRSAGMTPSPRVWRSEDGLHWNRLQAQGLPAEDVTSLAAVGDGYVAALGPKTANGVTTYFPAFFSADGASWQPGPLVGKVVGQGGHVVAVTADSSLDLSDDGKTWTPLHPARHIVNVVASRDGFLAYASDESPAPIILGSSDGRTWTAGGIAAGDWSGGMVYAMRRWVTVGGPNQGSPIFTSTDGFSWQSSAIPYELRGRQLPGDRLFAGTDGFFATSSLASEPIPGYDASQVHLWWVRQSQEGDVPGFTPTPASTPTPTPDATS